MRFSIKYNFVSGVTIALFVSDFVYAPWPRGLCFGFRDVSKVRAPELTVGEGCGRWKSQVCRRNLTHK